MNMLKPVFRRSVSPPDMCSISGHSRLSGWKISSSTCLRNGRYVAYTKQGENQEFDEFLDQSWDFKNYAKNTAKTLFTPLIHKHPTGVLQRMLISIARSFAYKERDVFKRLAIGTWFYFDNLWMFGDFICKKITIMGWRTQNTMLWTTYKIEEIEY